MAARKPFLNVAEADIELLELLEKAKNHELSDEELKEQQISFVFGNAMNSERITKDSARRTVESMRFVRAGN